MLLHLLPFSVFLPLSLFILIDFEQAAKKDAVVHVSLVVRTMACNFIWRF